MIEMYVAVVTTAIVLPLGVCLGAAWERARAELRRPPAAHEVLARVYQMEKLLAEQHRPERHCIRCWSKGFDLCERCAPALPADILAELRGPLGKGPA